MHASLCEAYFDAKALAGSLDQAPVQFAAGHGINQLVLPLPVGQQIRRAVFLVHEASAHR
jgi:hypothetical protein